MTHTSTQAITIASFAIIASLAILGFAPLASAAPVEMTDGFVCPVFNESSSVGEKNPNAIQIGGGDYTIVGPEVRVPVGATNDDGAGSPGGAHAVPGDSTYTAIWSG